jgi:hypothetical protein
LKKTHIYLLAPLVRNKDKNIGILRTRLEWDDFDEWTTAGPWFFRELYYIPMLSPHMPNLP